MALEHDLDWNNINYENTQIFIPPITRGKVIRVYSGDIIEIATKIHFINDNLIYRFMIHLDGISATRINPLIKLQNENGNESKNKLYEFIYGKIINLSNISVDKHGKIYATIFLEKINVNDWLIQYKYAFKCKKYKKRRMSESNSNIYDSPKKNINNISSLYSSNQTNMYPLLYNLPSVNNSHSNDSNDTKYLSQKSKVNTNNYISMLPIINSNQTITNYRPNSSNSSSLIQTDCFLSHNWGENHKNHNIVLLINEAIQKRGLNTWFDENKIDGNIRYKMAEGIDNTKCFVVFITKEYRDKVNGIDMKDNCKYEFTYAMNQLGSQNMIPIIMEIEMKDTKLWKGELGAALGNMLFIDFSDENMSEIEKEKKYDELYKRIRKIIFRNNRNTR